VNQECSHIVVSLPSSCLTTRESFSGSHLGHGHATVKVARNSSIMEYSGKLPDALILTILLLFPNCQFSQINTFSSDGQFYIQA